MPAIASRTPEGDPLRCALCGQLADVEFSSFPVADAWCPHCNAWLLAERDKLCRYEPVAIRQDALRPARVTRRGPPKTPVLVKLPRTPFHLQEITEPAAILAAERALG